MLVAPPRSEGRVPAVVYLHGSGGDRTQLLPLASSLAARGAVALTLTLPSGDATPPTGLSPEETLRWQRDTIVADVVAVRRALDVLAADERVDPERLGLVGWSFGGRIGALRAGHRRAPPGDDADVGRRRARVGVRRRRAGRSPG